MTHLPDLPGAERITMDRATARAIEIAKDVVRDYKDNWTEHDPAFWAGRLGTSLEILIAAVEAGDR